MHVVENLCQAEAAQVLDEGWVGSNAFFGSTNSCVDLKNQLNYNQHSTSNKIYITFQFKSSMTSSFFATQIVQQGSG